jgi:D-glycero-beta-D-manno-heptose-7-phosphate kinase
LTLLRSRIYQTVSRPTCDIFRHSHSERIDEGACLTNARKTRKHPTPPKSSRGAATKSANKSDATVDLTRLLGIVASFPRQTIGVVGDFVLDEFVSGEISRISREAPVLILRHRCSETYPGGAANAVFNLADLGARVLPVGVVGDDPGGSQLLEHFRRKRINVSGILRARDWVTATKTRYLAGWTHTTEQQVLRVDREPQTKISASIENAVAQKARQIAKRASAVLVSDYGFGAVSPAMIKKLNAKILTLDSRYRLLEFRDVGITAATPNEPEVEAAYHAQVGTDTRKLEDLGQRALRDLNLQALVVTRGKDGMALFERSRVPRNIPIYGSDAPVDVTGAGDTVIAVFTLALASGATYLEAAHLANYAGGVVVMKRRTATVTSAELTAALRQDATAQR